MQIIIAILSFAVIGIFLIRSLFYLRKKPNDSKGFEMGTFLNQESLAAHGRELARDMQVSQMGRGKYRPCFDRDALTEVLATLKERETDLGAGEWLVDNFYLLSNELTRLSARCFTDLPVILRGRGSGKRRVEYLAEELSIIFDAEVKIYKFSSLIVLRREVYSQILCLMKVLAWQNVSLEKN